MKRKINLISEKKPLDNQIRFFDNVLYNDSVILLKDIIDIKSFYFVTSTDTIGKIKTDVFKDKNHIYYFQDLPSTYPLIRVKNYK